MHAQSSAMVTWSLTAALLTITLTVSFRGGTSSCLADADANAEDWGSAAACGNATDPVSVSALFIPSTEALGCAYDVLQRVHLTALILYMYVMTWLHS